MTIFTAVMVGATVLVFGYQIIHFIVYAKNYFGMKETFDFQKSYFKIFLCAFIISRLSLCLSLGII